MVISQNLMSILIQIFPKNYLNSEPIQTDLQIGLTMHVNV